MGLRNVNQSIFGSITPATYGADNSSVSLATLVHFGAAGVVRAIRLFLDDGDNDIHIVGMFLKGDVFSKVGNVYLGNQSASAPIGVSGHWFNCWLQKPLKVSAGQDFYVAAYYPFGRYWLTPHFFDTSHSNGSLSSPADNPSGDRNGMFIYNPSLVYPTGAFNASWYGTDVLVGEG
jgi:hypothetical protein